MNQKNIIVGVVAFLVVVAGMFVLYASKKQVNETSEQQNITQQISSQKLPIQTKNVISQVTPQAPQVVVTSSATNSQLSNETETKVYRNDEYGFEFKYPADVSIETGGQGIFFRFLKPVVFVKSNDGQWLFTIGTTDYFQRDSASEKFVLESRTDVIVLKENCTESFFGNSRIRSAQMSFGDGYDWSIFHNILTSQYIGLGIETYRMYVEQPQFTPSDVEKEKARMVLEEQILSTFKFFGGVNSIDFVCKNRLQ